MRLLKPLIALALVAALAGCSKPLPAERMAYAGEWQSKSMALLISKEGQVSYRRVEGNQTTSVNAPLKEFQGDNFVVGVGPMSTTFVVSAPPHEVDGQWKMTVDGVELTKEP